MATVGLIGLGLLGSALAQRMLRGGYDVVGFDTNPAQAEALAKLGGQPVVSAREVVARCEQIVLSLPDTQVVIRVLESVEPESRGGQHILDTTTGEPLETAAIAARLAARDIDYLDATILGSSVQVAQGEAIVMVGAADAAFAANQALLDCFGREVFHVGPPGSGSRMKLVVNLVLGLHRAVLAEGLTLAQALELDPAMALTILKAGAAYSAVMDSKGDKMLRGDFAPQARLSQHLKDVRLMLAAAARTGANLPLSDVHRQLLERAEAAGYGDADNSAILRAFDR